VDTASPLLVGGFELACADAAQVAVTSGGIVERLDIVGHVFRREIAVLVRFAS